MTVILWRKVWAHQCKFIGFAKRLRINFEECVSILWSFANKVKNYAKLRRSSALPVGLGNLEERCAFFEVRKTYIKLALSQANRHNGLKTVHRTAFVTATRCDRPFKSCRIRAGPKQKYTNTPHKPYF